MNLQIVGAGVGDSRTALAGQVDSLIVAAVQPLLSNTAIYHGCRVGNTYMSQPWAPVTTTHIQVGGGTARSLPTQCRPITAFKTAMVGRKYRGRAYGFTPDDVQIATDGTVSVGVQNAWATIFDTFRAGLVVNGTTWKLVILHKWPGVPTVLPTPTPVTEVVRREGWGTQHRSGDYGRPNTLPW